MSEQLKKNYELLVILNAKEDASKAAIADITKLFEKHGATVTEESLWGTLKLAYEIKHQTQGTYMLWRVSIEPTNVNKLTGELEVAEHVLRFLMTEQPKNQQPITMPVLEDRRDKGGAGNGKGRDTGKGVDKSKSGADAGTKAPEDKKKSLDEILEEKI